MKWSVTGTAIYRCHNERRTIFFSFILLLYLLLFYLLFIYVSVSFTHWQRFWNEHLVWRIFCFHADAVFGRSTSCCSCGLLLLVHAAYIYTCTKSTILYYVLMDLGNFWYTMVVVYYMVTDYRRKTVRTTEFRVLLYCVIIAYII